MIRFTRRALAVVSASAFAVAGIGLAAPDNLADQINEAMPGEEEFVFAVNKCGPHSVIGIWDPARRSPNTLMVECDPELDTWESHLRGSCSGNEESLLAP